MSDVYYMCPCQRYRFDLLRRRQTFEAELASSEPSLDRRSRCGDIPCNSYLALQPGFNNLHKTGTDQQIWTAVGRQLDAVTCEFLEDLSTQTWLPACTQCSCHAISTFTLRYLLWQITAIMSDHHDRVLA